MEQHRLCVCLPHSLQLSDRSLALAIICIAANNLVLAQQGSETEQHFVFVYCWETAKLLTWKSYRILDIKGSIKDIPMLPWKLPWAKKEEFFAATFFCRFFAATECCIRGHIFSVLDRLRVKCLAVGHNADWSWNRTHSLLVFLLDVQISSN